MNALSLVLGGLLATALAAGGHGASPDDPRARVKPNRYSSITSGTKSYRPVEPLPWGDVIRRVTPKKKDQPKEGQAPQDKQGAPTQPQHKQ